MTKETTERYSYQDLQNFINGQLDAMDGQKPTTALLGFDILRMLAYKFDHPLIAAWMGVNPESYLFGTIMAILKVNGDYYIEYLPLWDHEDRDDNKVSVYKLTGNRLGDGSMLIMPECKENYWDKMPFTDLSIGAYFWQDRTGVTGELLDAMSQKRDVDVERLHRATHEWLSHNSLG